jgi:hypothetical protein
MGTGETQQDFPIHSHHIPAELSFFGEEPGECQQTKGGRWAEGVTLPEHSNPKPGFGASK